MRVRPIATIVLLALATTVLIAAAHTTLATPSDAAPITAQAPVAPAAQVGTVEVTGTATTSSTLGAEVWAGGARPPLPGTSVRNYVERGRREASDARLAGHFEAMSGCDYEFPEAGYVGSCWAVHTLGNDGGTWEGMGSATVTWTAAAMALTLVEDYVMHGQGGYAGLAHRGRSECIATGHGFECTWSGSIEPVFAPAEIEVDLAARMSRWSGTWRPTEVEDAGDARISTFDGRCSRPAFALHHSVTEGLDTYLGHVTATMTHCWYRTFAAEGIGVIQTADGSTLEISYDQLAWGADSNGNWSKNALTITGGTGRFTGASGAGTLWGEAADIDAVLGGADAPQAWMSLGLVLRPSMVVRRP